MENRIPKIQNKERRRRRKKEREEYYSSNNRTNSKLVLGVNRCKMIVRADYYKRYYKRWQWDDTTRHDESDDTEIGLLDKDQFCSISVDRRRGCTRSYNSLTTPRDARGWEWIDNAAKMVSGKRDQRIVRLLARRTTDSVFKSFIITIIFAFQFAAEEKIYHFSTIIYKDLLRIISRTFFKCQENF